MANQSIRGLGQLILQTATNNYIPLVYGSSGTLYQETLIGTGSLQVVASGLQPDAFAAFSTGYGREYIGFSDRIAGTAAPKQYYQYLGGMRFRGLAQPPQALPATGAERTTLGDVDAGIRYGVVFFETETGYRSGFTPAAVFQITSADPEMQLAITNVPVGPPGTVKRWIAFTPAGGSSAGDFFIIEQPETLQEANAPYTATLIDDNVTTSINLNFTDLFLQSSTNVTQFFDKIEVPRAGVVKFLPTIRRVAYYLIADSPSTVYVSEADDPETLYPITSALLVAQDNGQRVMSVFEFRHSIYIAKERGGHELTVGTATDNTTPASWTITEKWDQVGPCGSDALDVCDEFVAFASRKGLYKFDGGGAPDWISWEHGQSDGLWAQINWEYGHLINVTIDAETKRIFVAVPLGQNTECSHVLTCDYSNGFAQPVQANPQNGVLMSIRGRRWSVDNVATNKIVRMERPLEHDGNPNTPPANNAQTQSQLLVASSAPDGAVNMFDVTARTDNGQKIDAAYAPAYMSPGGLYTLGAVTADVRGTGNLLLTAFSSAGVSFTLKAMFVDAIWTERTVKSRGSSANWTIEFASQSPGDWWEIGEIALWLLDKWATQVEGK